MTIDEAIKTLNEFWKDIDTSWRGGLPDALGLGIEALKFIQLSRVAAPGTVPKLLHGETEE